MIQIVEDRMMLNKELTGWIDIDRPLLPGLSPEERIDFFEKRVKLVAITPLVRLFGPLRQEIDAGSQRAGVNGDIPGGGSQRGQESTGTFLALTGVNGDKLTGTFLGTS